MQIKALQAKKKLWLRCREVLKFPSSILGLPYSYVDGSDTEVAVCQFARMEKTYRLRATWCFSGKAQHILAKQS